MAKKAGKRRYSKGAAKKVGRAMKKAPTYPASDQASSVRKDLDLARPWRIGGRIGHHPVEQFIREIIERAKSIALRISGGQEVAVARQCWF